MALGFAAIGIGTADLLIDKLETKTIYSDANVKAFEAYPRMAREDREKAQQAYELEQKANDLIKQKKYEEAQKILKSDKFADYLFLNKKKNFDDFGRNKLYTEIINENTDYKSLATYIPLAILSYYLIGKGLHNSRYLGGAFKERDNSRMNKVVDEYRPEWASEIPVKEDVDNFFKSVTMLPPIGGKIPLTDKNKHKKVAGFSKKGRLFPDLTAEGFIDRVIEKRKSEDMGSYHTLQLSIPGRFKNPDRFKYVAILLNLISPVQVDHTQPYVNAPWGNVAPLVHDGGVDPNNVNPRWRGFKGRTDFFMTSPIFTRPIIDETVSANGEELMDSIELRENNELHGRVDDIEENRLKMAAKFYQRAAFALHAEEGTAPKSIGEDKLVQGANIWRNVEELSKELLLEKGIAEVGDAKWFEDKPRRRKGMSISYGKRYEADSFSVRLGLALADKAKFSDPELSRRAVAIIQMCISEVDDLIGLRR